MRRQLAWLVLTITASIAPESSKELSFVLTDNALCCTEAFSWAYKCQNYILIVSREYQLHVNGKILPTWEATVAQKPRERERQSRFAVALSKEHSAKTQLTSKNQITANKITDLIRDRVIFIYKQKDQLRWCDNNWARKEDAKYKICEIKVTRWGKSENTEVEAWFGCERENVEGYLFPSGSEVVTLGNGSGIWKRLRWTSASHFPLLRSASASASSLLAPPAWLHTLTAPSLSFPHRTLRFVTQFILTCVRCILSFVFLLQF